MKLLFSSSNIDDLFKDLLGFVDADFRFENIISDIITASNDVQDLIGKEVYKHIAEYAETEPNEDFEDEDYMILRSSRLAIAAYAYRLYAPHNDLSHTNDGRKMRNEEHEKSAFQWMIDADDKALEKKYYRTLEQLLRLLDESKPENYDTFTNEEKEATIYYKWTNSEAFNQVKKLFISTVKEFDNFYPINSRLLMIRFAPGMSECERREILPRIGQSKYDLLKLVYKGKSLVEIPNKDSLLLLIQEAIASYALAWAIPRFNVNFFPEGILQFYGSDKQTTSGNKPSLMMEPEAARQAYALTCKRALSDIEQLLKPAPEPTDKKVLPDIHSESTDNHFSAT
ncbi:MAG TPA: hypothetical protein DDZ41_03540 [Flavobacterium sp.]|nr:hypothetical protein [Flavobacterium sp.]